MELLNRLNDYDQQLFSKVFKQRDHSIVIPLAMALSRSGEGVLHVLIPVLVWQLDRPELPILVSLLALAFALERAFHWSLKNLLKRPRPQNAISGVRSLGHASNQFSFPSGHSSRAFLLATVLVIIYGAPAVVIYIWACAVALARVTLGVHYPGDTLAGALVGSGVALFSATLLGLL